MGRRGELQEEERHTRRVLCDTGAAGEEAEGIGRAEVEYS